jgi:parallel beta-helix repeat protein
MKRICLLTILCLLISCIPLTILIFSADTGAAGTVIPEVHYTTDRNWNMSGSPYYIEGHVFVEEGYNLTIEPGVEVRFNGSYSIEIKGNLIAIGEPGNEITFTSNASSPAVEDWDTILINTTGSGEIAYCDISYTSCAVTVNGSSENTIRDSTIHDSLEGLVIDLSDNVTMSSNNITDIAGTGVLLSESTGCDISNNNISDNFWHGIHLYKSLDNSITSNIIGGNFRGLYVAGTSGDKSGFNDIKYNQISSNRDGIHMQSFAEFNTIANNNISYNTWAGINITSGINNQIYHNTFWSNSKQAYDDTSGNAWDDGYPNGGNFWTDYAGVDEKRGANQDVPGSDDLGDEVYTIDPDSVDRYPLMNQTRLLAPYLIALVSPLNNSIIRAGTLLDFDILLQNPPTVNYTDNGASNTTITPPYDVNTTGWADGVHNVTVYVVDSSWQVNSSYFLFTVDSNGPEIVLVSPLNNSMFAAREVIDFDILDPNINSAVYRINNGSTENLMFPYDFNTSAWADGNYSIEIHADDVAGNANTSLFLFTLDSYPPFIVLTNPADISYIRPGTAINFSIADDHLASVTYSINGGAEQAFDVEYTINTTSFSDGVYNLRINAADDLGNSNFLEYNVTIDSVAPVVVLNSPLNNSVIRAGTPLNFSVFDDSPVVFIYRDRSGTELSLFSPYNINTSLWDDGTYPILVIVTDHADNTGIFWYNLTVDSLEPQIIGTDPKNNSFIQPFGYILVTIVESNLAIARYSANGGPWEVLTPHMLINVTDWQDGRYDIEIFVEDAVGNNASGSFVFSIDSTPPMIADTTPKNNDFGVETGTSIRIRFSEPMVQMTVNFGISTSPMFNFTYSWNLENTTLIITPKGDLADDTRYTIVINASAMDEAGNTMGEDFELTFETGEVENWTLWILLIIACVLLVAMLVTGYYIRRGKEGLSEEDEGGEDEFDLEEEKSPAGPEGEAQDLDEELLEGGAEEGADEPSDVQEPQGSSDDDQKIDNDGS